MSRIGAVGRAPLVARPEPPADRELLDCVWNGSLFQDGTTWRTRQGTVLKKKKKKKEVDDEDDDEDKDEDEGGSCLELDAVSSHLFLLTFDCINLLCFDPCPPFLE